MKKKILLIGIWLVAIGVITIFWPQKIFASTQNCPNPPGLFQATIDPSPPIPETSSDVKISISPLPGIIFDTTKTYKIQLILAGNITFEKTNLTVSNPDGPLQLTITPGDFLSLFYYSAFNPNGFELKVFAGSDVICSEIRIRTKKPLCLLSAFFSPDFRTLTAQVTNYTGRDTNPAGDPTGSYGPNILLQRITDCTPIIGCSITSYNINIQGGQGEAKMNIDPGDRVGTVYAIALTTAARRTDESCKLEITKPPVVLPTPTPGGPTPTPGVPPGEFDPCAGDATGKCALCLGPNREYSSEKVWTALGCLPTDPADFVAWLLSAAIRIGGGIAFLLMLWGGFQTMTSSGNPEKLNQGKDILVSAGVGLLFIIFAVLLLKIIGVDIFQLPGFKATPKPVG